MAFVSKVKDQKLELKRATFNNMQLKERQKYLDAEVKELADRLISNQIAWAEKNEGTIILKRELNDFRKIQDGMLEELDEFRNQITDLSLCLENETSMCTPLDEDKSVDENLQMKDEIIKCLQEQLVKVRLKEAETFATIHDLRKVARGLENEKELLTNTKPETISRLQEEIMDNKIRENQFKDEFLQTKAFLRNMREEIQAHVKSQKSGTGKDVEGKLTKLSSKGVIWERTSKTKSKNIEACELNIQAMNKETVHLKNKISELESQLDDLTKKIVLKEKVRSHLQETVNNAKIKERSVQSIITERKRQCAQLEDNATEKLSGIGNSKIHKRRNIFDLAERFESLSRNQSSQSLDVMGQDDSDMVRELEEKEKILEAQIDYLKCQNSTISRN